VFFQETKINNRDHFRTIRHHVTNHVGYKQYQLFITDERTSVDSSTATRRLGVATFFHRSMPGFDKLKVLWAKRVVGRYLVVRTEWEDTPVYFHNVYAPVEDDDRAAFFGELPRDFEDGSMHIVGGDFNLPMDAALDAMKFTARSHYGKAECIEWLAALRVVDPWRMANPDMKEMSGPHGRNRLDYIFVDHALVAHYHHSSRFDANKYRGDHKTHTTVLAQLGAPTAQASKKTWLLPRELLNDKRTVHAIQVEAQRLLDELDGDAACNKGAKWCGWLRRIKSRLRQGQYNRQRHRKATLDLLQRQWKKTKLDAGRGRLPEEAAATAKLKYDAAKAEMAQLSQDEGFARHANVNEVATAHFLRKPPATKVPIVQATCDGGVTTDPVKVVAVFTTHWRGIMTTPAGTAPPDAALQDDVINHVTAALSPEQRSDLDAPLTAAELCLAIKTMHKNKSPGPDGWPAAFFQTAPETFAAILVHVFDYQRTVHGCLLDHQRKSSVTLLYKKGERADPGNYRPIALMPVEVKILSRALAYRLSGVATTLVHPSQAGFIKGRSITDLIHLVEGLQLAATTEDREWYATFLDYAKAYDMVRWPFLFAVMEKMCIGPEFMAWVRLLYKKPRVHLLINGALGPAIRPNRGVKQGCPLSCLLFDLYLEPLGAMLRACPDAGIALDDGTVLTGAFFADDSTILSGSFESAEYQVDVIVGQFCAASGAALNKDKCVTLALNAKEDPGERADRRGFPSLTIAEPGQPIRFLGTYVGQGLAADYNVQLLNDRFLASFAHWGCRARTIQGRRVLATSVILSTLWYVTAVTVVPERYTKVWQRTLNNYVVGAKTDSDVKYRPPINSMWLHDKRLGLGIPHIASKLRGQRLRSLQRLMTASTADDVPAWAKLVLGQFKRCMQTAWRESHRFDFLCYQPHALSAWLLLDTLHPLWRDVWSEWSKVSWRDRMPRPPDLATTLSMPVWLTTHPEFVRPSGVMAASVAAKSVPARQVCQHGLSNGLRSLRDFLHNAGPRFRGYWPDFDRFQQAMSSGYSGLEVDMRFGQIWITLVPYLRTVHTHLTAVLDAVRTRLHVRRDVSLADVAEAPHAFRKLVKNQDTPFELWPRREVVAMAYHGPRLAAPHPTSTPTRVGYEAARQYMTLLKESCRLLTPVHGDVWFRATMNMLPVHARYLYLKEVQPDIVKCSHGCGEDETSAHVLRDCGKVAPLWALHEAAWRGLGTDFNWMLLMNIDGVKIDGHGALFQAAMVQLWIMLAGVTLHLMWLRRNYAKHRAEKMPPPQVLLDASFVTWMTTVRRWIRLQDPEDPALAAMHAALAILLRQVHYRDLRAKYPRCLELDTSFDVH
jgi:hypothetical protein